MVENSRLRRRLGQRFGRRPGRSFGRRLGQRFGRSLVPRLDDRGSGAIAVIFFAILFVALAGFVVDGGMAISKRERAADLAEQAARYAAQDIDVAALRNSTQQGATPPILLDNCQGDVRHYLESAGVARTDVDQAGCDLAKSTTTVVYVFVQVTYKPMLSGFLSDRAWTAKATASATNLSGN